MSASKVEELQTIFDTVIGSAAIHSDGKIGFRVKDTNVGIGNRQIPARTLVEESIRERGMTPKYATDSAAPAPLSKDLPAGEYVIMTDHTDYHKGQDANLKMARKLNSLTGKNLKKDSAEITYGKLIEVLNEGIQVETKEMPTHNR